MTNKKIIHKFFEGEMNIPIKNKTSLMIKINIITSIFSMNKGKTIHSTFTKLIEKKNDLKDGKKKKKNHALQFSTKRFWVNI
jgi:hypothetical protein